MWPNDRFIKLSRELYVRFTRLGSLHETEPRAEISEKPDANRMQWQGG